MSFTTKQLLIVVGCIAIVAGAFASGNRLGAGWYFAIMAVATLVIQYRTFAFKRSLVTRMFATGLGAVVFCFAVTPETFNSDLAYVVEVEQRHRQVVSELDFAISSDERFANITYECSIRKVTSVRINGHVAMKNDLIALRELVIDQCPSCHPGNLYWDIQIRESNGTTKGLDKRLFETGHSAAKI